ncbi:hypothetical protein RB200_40235 [Streptomyces sp. PmtG]
MTLFVTLILGLIFGILGLSYSWPLWAWLATAALLLIVAAITHKVLSNRAAEPLAIEVSEPELIAVARPELRVTNVALPSAVADYDFAFSATVCWTELEARDGAPSINPGGLAVDAILQRARILTEQQQPTHSAFVQHQLNGTLGTMREDSTGRVLAMAQDVSLHLPELDYERLCKLSNVRKDADVWEHERSYERSKRAYLSNDVLKDTGSAVVWWLSRNDEEVEGTVDRIGLLARLSAAANNDTVAAPFEHLVRPAGIAHADAPLTSDERQTPTRWTEGSIPYDGTAAHASADADSLDAFLSWFGFSPADPDLEMFADRLINLARVHGKPKAIDEIRRRFGFDQPGAADETEPTPPDSLD